MPGDCTVTEINHNTCICKHLLRRQLSPKANIKLQIDRLNYLTLCMNKVWHMIQVKQR